MRAYEIAFAQLSKDQLIIELKPLKSSDSAVSDKPKRRWYQFSLKGAFVLLTVFACLSAGLSYSLQKWRNYQEQWQSDQKAIKVGELIQRAGGYWEEGKGIDLTKSRITKGELTHLLKELQTIDRVQLRMHLRGTAFDDSHVRDLVCNRELMSLNLSNTAITDNGLKELSALKCLEWVDLNNDNITDDGLQYLAAIPTLKYIEVQGTKVTREGIEKLKRTFPTLEVNTYPSDY